MKKFNGLDRKFLAKMKEQSKDSFLYVLVGKDIEWEDIVIVRNEYKAIELSKENPDCRVEIFKSNENENGKYLPVYQFYKNGVIGVYL